MDRTGNYHIECYGVNVKGSPIDPCVGTLDPQLMAMLFGKARELLGGEALLEEMSLDGGLLEFIALPHMSSSLSLLFYLPPFLLPV